MTIMAAILVIIVAVAVIHRIQVRRNAEGLADLARAKVAERKPLEAIALFARYLSFRPNDATALAEFAKLLVARVERPDATRRDRAWAYDALEAAVSRNPTDRWLRSTLADYMLRSGRFGAAGEQLDILLDRDSASSADGDTEEPEDRTELLLMRARAYLGTGNYREAAELLAGICSFDLNRKRFIADENDPGTHSERSILLTYQASIFLSALLDEKLRDTASGRAILDHLVEMNATDFRAWLARANWHRSHGDFAKASEDLTSARELAPDDPGVLFTSFEIAMAQKRFAEAEQLAVKGRKLFPKDERVYRSIASVAARQGDLERAAAALRDGLGAKLDDPSRIRLLLADILLLQGHLDEAEETVAEYTAQYGADNPDLGLLEARLLIAQARWLPAKKKLEALRPLVASSAEVTKQVDIYLGKCHEQLGDFDEQLAANRRVLSEDHESIQARIGAAAALATTGRPEEALAEYEAIASSLPPERLAATAEIWNPLLQLRVAEQLKRPAADRDWSQIDGLIDLLEQSPTVSAVQLALLKSDALVRKGDPGGAETLLRGQLAANPQSPHLAAALMTLLLRNQGVAAARSVLATTPADIADSPLVMTVEAQMAARMPAEESAAIFAELEAKADHLPDAQAGQLLATLGSMRRGMAQPGEAERLWLKALKKRPEDLQIVTALLELAYEQGDVDKADARAAEIGGLAGEASPQGRIARATALALSVRRQQVKGAQDGDGPAPDRGEVELSASEKERLTAAYNLLVEAENDRPGWVRIQKLFAEIAILRGNMPEAIERLQRATRMGAADPSLLRQLLSLLYLSNRIDEAQQTLARLGPESLPGLERLSAEIELSTGRFDDAVALAERGVDTNANVTASDLLWFGQLLARAGKLERATEVLQRAIDADPKRPEGWLALLSSEVAAGQRRAAERTLDKASQTLEPPHHQPVMAQGSELLGRFDDAERYFREAVSGERINIAAARNLASFLVRRGRLTEARDELRRVIASTADTPEAVAGRAWARRTLAMLLSQSGSYRDMEESLALLDDNATDGQLSADDLTLKIGILANRPEPANWRLAIDLTEQLSKLQPLSNAHCIQRSQLLEKCGRWEDARNELVALVSRPDTPPAVQSMLIEKLLQHGERDSAKAWLKKLSDRFPDAPVVLVLQAKLALAENDRPTAVEAARKLMPNESLAAQPEQIGSIAALMETLGFGKAADKAFEQYAAATKNGVTARAAFLGRQHRTDEALDLLEAQWDRIPLLPLMQTAVTVLQSQGTNASPEQRDRIAAWFVKADRQDPGSASLQLLLADLHSFNGRDGEAMATYRSLLAREDLPPTQTAVVANNLAFLLARPESAAEAEQLVDRAILELGPSPDILDTRGVVLLAAGKTGAAVAALTEAVLEPSAPKYLHLACALAADRQIEAARKAYAQATQLGLEPLSLSADDRLRLAVLQSAIGN